MFHNTSLLNGKVFIGWAVVQVASILPRSFYRPDYGSTILWRHVLCMNKGTHLLYQNRTLQIQKSMHIPLGAQIWSLRKLMQYNAETTLEAIARAGYRFIEPAGFNITDGSLQGFAPKTLKTLAANQGLKIHSGHFQLQPQDVHAMCECAAEAGMQFIIISNLREELQHGIDGYKKAADELNEMGETANIYGLQLGYHNHAYEFEKLGDQIPFDILLQNTDPRYVTFQADIGWMVYAGQAPQHYFNIYAGRFPLWHLRDLEAANNPECTAIGKGIINYPPIFAEKNTAGLQYAIVEMSSLSTSPLEKIVSSYPYAKSILHV